MGGNRRNGVTLEVKVKESTNQTIYRAKVDSSNIGKLSLVFSTLEGLGIRVTEAIARMIMKEDADSNWFR